MTYKINENMLPMYNTSSKPNEKRIDEYIQYYRDFLINQVPKEASKEMCSGMNRMKRKHMWCSKSVDLVVRVGDIVYIEYGQAFLNEAGFQHFGLIVSVWNRKIMVVPMTSNSNAFQNAINVHQDGKSHLYYIGFVKGLSSHSTLFLNDVKMINSCRIISVNGHICPKTRQFQEIIEHLSLGLFDTAMVK